MSVASCSSSGAGGPAQVVRVKRELLIACMTCPLCHKLLRDATTISECLHTFCRKCIYEKLTDEELDSCPICSTDLGCTPIEKLRPDHNIQDVRSKIFPFKRRKVEAPELVPSISLPIRRKERSLSSLVVNTPRVATQSGLTRRRTKAAGRKAAALRGLDIDEPIKKEDDAEDCPATSGFAETLDKISQNIRQNNFNAGTSNHASNKNAENGEEPSADKTELWKPLNCLVEAANRTKTLNSSDQGSVAKTEQINFTEIEENAAPRNKAREHLQKPKMLDDKNSNYHTTVLSKTRRVNGAGRKRAAASRELETSAQASLCGTSVKRERETNPIWFSLISAPDREGDAQLPQLSSSYLRIKDGTLPVLLIQKYLAKKLDLASETEVEITCRGQAVVPSLALHKLVDLWLHTGSSQRAVASAGSSAENFVMVLGYARRVPPAAT
ncbi:unnamed protein product [Spirodela intermedia]|uniref:RING-type domain-containing protein n=1 Tax=Spirodela intermedia TaxID=51605 RepID=A0A7I8KDI5_SPIIN|nr:unnamed protein product [Spirodela intermedia]